MEEDLVTHASKMMALGFWTVRETQAWPQPFTGTVSETKAYPARQP